MPPFAWPGIPARTTLSWPRWICAALLTLWVIGGHGMVESEVLQLRRDTQELFYHGYSNYMTHAFPEDELKPISCKPQTRNRRNPADIGVNDVLGNYSLTLIDSLSTLAILASSPDTRKDKRNPLRDFQDGIQSLVTLYGDGSDKKPCGTRACGFDLDSKVQVFETNIRGVGGLLSAHLFAMGELPIMDYAPQWKSGRNEGIRWKNGLVYNGQLLRLAHDLASRLLPAFSTKTDIPYPRVNLRDGIPFYRDAEAGLCRLDGTSTDVRELTENCAAGAGSLILEFSTLSRLTGDMRFERLAKRAFWAIWNRRSAIGLLGNGIDAENGQWTVPSLSGIGAGIDSFFEYSFKSYVLLSNLPYDTNMSAFDAPDSFLHVWEQAHAAVKRHVRRTGKTEKHPYYGQVDLLTGAPRYSWIDSLSAYYPGLLVQAGELDEAVESHLLFNALWTRYSALPERWTAANALIDSHFKHWSGRPEFIESTFYLYQATKDPYYLHVGEMTLRDIRRRCWTKCGWTALNDVLSGEQRDRMESFFLGETAKYLYLLFSEDHPLNKLDRPVVFTTEGHPLVIPDVFRTKPGTEESKIAMRVSERQSAVSPGVCPAPPWPLPLTVSNVADRLDLFHAAALARLHLIPFNPTRTSPLMEPSQDGPGIFLADVRSPTNYTFHPWTLPQDLIPAKGMSSRIESATTSVLTFPNLSGSKNAETDLGLIPLGALQKIDDGILINSLSNMRLNMIQQPKIMLAAGEDGVIDQQVHIGEEYHIHGIANWPLGRDEKVVLSSEALKGFHPNDPHFTRLKDSEMLDLVLDVPVSSVSNEDGSNVVLEDIDLDLPMEVDGLLSALLSTTGLSDIASVVTSHLKRGPITHDAPVLRRHYIPAILPSGPGAAPLPTAMDTDENRPVGLLPFRSLYFLSDPLCTVRLPASIAKTFNILVIERGGCSFGGKLANIPSFPPSAEALQLVVVVSYPSGRDDGYSGLIRPLLDQTQLTPNGIVRRHPLAMVMVEAVDGNAEALKGTATGCGFFDEDGSLFTEKCPRGGVAGDVSGAGFGAKRRYWFESLGVPIGNLYML